MLILGFLLAGVALFSQSEEEKIKALLNAETEDFTKMAFADVVKNHWILDDKAMVLVTMPDGNHVIEKKKNYWPIWRCHPPGTLPYKKAITSFL